MTPTTPVSIVRASPADAAAVAAMVGEIADLLGQGPVTVSAQTWEERLIRDDVIVLVAWRAGEAIGYVSAIRRLHLWSPHDVIALDDLYVREGERGDGVGERLIRALAAGHAHDEGLTITWGCEPSNTGALRFYERLGARLHTKVHAAWSPTAAAETA